MDDYDELDILVDEDFDCGWTHVEGQLCDDAGSESCSFFCPYYQAMMKSLQDHPNLPPTWAQVDQPEYWTGGEDGDDE
ncbi:MAG: hypothetical protein K8L91_19760 [Anaerolineae bacterium]|nr:hypothetical protein [Anaerolineae bacterium]